MRGPLLIGAALLAAACAAPLPVERLPDAALTEDGSRVPIRRDRLPDGREVWHVDYEGLSLRCHDPTPEACRLARQAFATTTGAY